MCVVATFTVPGEHCLFSRAVPETNSVEIELDRVVPLGGLLTPMLWVRDGANECEDFVAALEAQSPVERVTELERADARRLYKLDWASQPDGVIGHLLETDAAVLTATGTAEGFDFVIRFNTSDALSDFHERCRDSGVKLEVTGVRQRQDTEEDGPGLTAQQRETLLRAYEEGYYDVPRNATHEDVGDALGCSGGTVGEHLRKIEATILTEIAP